MKKDEETPCNIPIQGYIDVMTTYIREVKTPSRVR